MIMHRTWADFAFDTKRYPLTCSNIINHSMEKYNHKSYQGIVGDRQVSIHDHFETNCRFDQLDRKARLDFLKVLLSQRSYN
jgi:hypothetical protein